MIETKFCRVVLAGCAMMSLSAWAGTLLAPGLELPAFTGGARSYAVTTRGDWVRENFRAEVTVTLRSGHGGNGCAFFGLGKGVADPSNYGEPTVKPALLFRVAPDDFAGGQMAITLNGVKAADEVHLGDGTHRLRLSWDAARKCAWLQIHPNGNGGAGDNVFVAKETVSIAVGTVDFGADARLFVGGAEGVSFSSFTVDALSEQELRKLPRSDRFASDPSARTWLPVAGASALPKGEGAVAPVDDFLKDLKATLRPVVCFYEGPRLQAARPLPGGKLELPNSRWELAVVAAPVTGDPDARDVTVSVTLREGGALSAGIAAAFDFSAWSTNNYVLIPASVYNGNRFRTVGRGYCAGLDQADYYRKDLPLTQTVVPRLSIDAGAPSKLEVAACNVTTPAICVQDRATRRGFILLAEQAGRNADGDFIRKSNGEIMDNALAVEESADRSHATLVVGAPGVRESKPEFIGFSESPDRGMAWKAGDRVVLKLRVYSFASPGIPSLLDKFMSVRKAVTGSNRPRCLAPASQVGQWMAARIDSRFLTSPAASFYCPENGPWIAFGWIGGWIDTFPMLALGDDMHLQRVTQTFDHGLKAQTSAGYFHYAIDAHDNVTFREPRPDMNLSRTTGDILYWMIKQFEVLKAQGRGQAIKPAWETSMRRQADALVATWRKNGEWGKMINVKTGEVSEYNTTGGATCIGGLALAARYFNNPDYLKIAAEAADFYYERDFVRQGLTSGGCADILQNPDSETAAGFMTSLMALYEVTGDGAWLEKSRNLANLAATWTVSYDYELPKFTELGGLGAKLAGVYWASTQNKHGAPGICTSSGDPLFKIFRATGDRRYAEMMRDIIAAHGESIRPGGFTNERLTYCDADSRGSRGGHVTGWNETNGMLMSQELPGIYLRTDIDRFFVFDSVDAIVVSRTASGVKIAINNATPFDAQVTIFAENGVQAQKPQGYTAFLKWPKVAVKAGETRTIEVGADGTVK